MGGFEKLWNRFLKYTIGWGYKPWRTAWSFAFLVVFSLTLVAFAQANGAIVGTGPFLEVPPDADTCSSQYPCFNKFAYTLDLFLPYLNLQREAWRPDTSSSWGIVLQWGTTLARICGVGLLAGLGAAAGRVLRRAEV